MKVFYDILTDIDEQKLTQKQQKNYNYLINKINQEVKKYIYQRSKNEIEYIKLLRFKAALLREDADTYLKVELRRKYKKLLHKYQFLRFKREKDEQIEKTIGEITNSVIYLTGQFKSDRIEPDENIIYLIKKMKLEEK